MKKLVIVIALLSAPFCLAEGEGKRKGAYKGALKEIVLERFDTDGDGTLSESEREAAKAEREARREEFSALRNSYDVNGDGELDETEREAFKAAAKEVIIKNFDSDGDGVLSETEQAAVKAVQARRGKKAHCDGDCKKGEKGARGSGRRGAEI